MHSPLTPSYRVLNFLRLLRFTTLPGILKEAIASLSFLILHLINALTNVCAPTKTPVRTTYQSTGLHNEQSSNGGHFDLDATEVDGFGSIGVEIDQLPRMWTRFQRGPERTAEVQDDQVERG